MIVDVIDAGFTVFRLDANQAVFGIPRVAILVVLDEVAVEIVGGLDR